ncbi:MAG: FKBP-type peptidyl-prolyl cis-trans isomerase [Chromatiales bacterium]|nr:FKBP-type peptidyl-prolyl cis-trans isomerase [Chromatiales bacterium]
MPTIPPGYPQGIWPTSSCSWFPTPRALSVVPPCRCLAGADMKRLYLLACLITVISLLTGCENEQDRARAVENLAKAQAFLNENGQKQGVKTTASGLQYEISREGDGPRPAADAQVRVHYEGRLLDGSVFDSSYERKQSISFPLNQVIDGWQEALQLMPVGSKWRLYLPPELGYGRRGMGQVIAPNSLLIFDVELLAIE